MSAKFLHLLKLLEQIGAQNLLYGMEFFEILQLSICEINVASAQSRANSANLT